MGETARRQRNRIRDAVVKILKYKMITIDNTIYIKILYYGTMSYLTVYTDDVLNTTNNETEILELRIVFLRFID